MSKQEEIKQALAAATQGEPKGMTLGLMGERDYWRSEFHKVFSKRERALEENERLRKELEEARTFKFPRQEVPSGWHLKFGYLLKIQERVQQETEHTIELEEIEAVLLTLERVGQEGEGNQDE